jgi:hypothetical protein
MLASLQRLLRSAKLNRGPFMTRGYRTRPSVRSRVGLARYRRAFRELPDDTDRAACLSNLARLPAGPAPRSGPHDACPGRNQPPPDVA